MAYLKEQFETTQDLVDYAFVHALNTSRVFPLMGEVVFLTRGIPVPRAIEKLKNLPVWAKPELNEDEVAELESYVQNCRDNRVWPFKAVAKQIAHHGNFDRPSVAEKIFPPRLSRLPQSIKEAVDFADVRGGQPHVYVVQFGPDELESDKNAGFLGFRSRYRDLWEQNHYEVSHGSWDYRRFEDLHLSDANARFNFRARAPSTFKFTIPDESSLSEGDRLYLRTWFGELKRDYAVRSPASSAG